ncbi:MAG TPA: MerR family transcriptional regulator [Longimicrobiales bacterium]
MTIGQLAARFGLATHVLRHWEDVGVLVPAERVNGRRRYGLEHVTRVAMILRAKEAGLTLEQIRQVFDAPGAAARRALLAGHLADLERRMRELAEAKEIVEHVLSCPADDFLTCLEFQAIVDRIVDRMATSGSDGARAGASDP